MSMRDWAKREVEIACKRENPDRQEGEWDYGCACYESALKAYNSLMDDGHSVMSWGFTKTILTRLMNSLPLTPIEDVPEVWIEIGENEYQCQRQHSLFKYVDKDGNVTYHDNDLIVCYDIGDDYSYHMGFIDRILRQKCPQLLEITMPYVPPEKPFEVYTDIFLSDVKEGDFDHIGIIYMITPQGQRIETHIYFDFRGNNVTEISRDEFYFRKGKAVKCQSEQTEGDSHGKETV